MTTELQRSPADPTAAAPIPSVGEASRRVTAVVLGLLLIVAGLALAGFLWSEALVRVEESTTTHAAVERVVLDLGADGNVEVRVHDADEVVVHQRVERTITGGDASQQVVGDALELRSQRCGSWVSVPLIRCSASFVVTVPATTEVVGELRHGWITLVGLGGGADVWTRHGSIEATDVAGPLNLRTDHGSVDVTGASDALHVVTGHGAVRISDVAGTTEVSSGHGRVVVDGAAGDLAAETDHGGIEVTGTTGEAITLVTGHGSIDLRPAVPPTSAELTTSHGDVTVALPPDAPPYDISAVGARRAADIDVATDPTADRRLELRTGHGRIDVHHATP